MRRRREFWPRERTLFWSHYAAIKTASARAYNDQRRYSVRQVEAPFGRRLVLRWEVKPL